MDHNNHLHAKISESNVWVVKNTRMLINILTDYVIYSNSLVAVVAITAKL